MSNFIGFGSSRVAAKFYTNPADTQRDAVYGTAGFAIQAARPDEVLAYPSQTPGIISMQYKRVLGEAYANFALVIKSSLLDLRDTILANDWVDLIAIEDGREIHLDRGLVLDVTQIISSNGGATAAQYLVTCASFGYIFETTRYWFDTVYQLQDANFAALQVHNLAGRFINQGVYNTVTKIAEGFLDRRVQAGTALWRLPNNMPGVQTDGQLGFLDNLFKYGADYDDDTFVRRSHIGVTGSLNYGSNLLELMMAWMDPMSCEMLVDLVNPNNGSAPPYIGMNNAVSATGRELLSPGQTAMALIVRERPFYTLATRPERLGEMYFDRTPLHVVEREQVQESRLSRSAAALVNHITYAPIQVVEQSAQAATYQIPLINRESIDTHGVRRIDIRTPYDVTEGNSQAAQIYRHITRDFNSLNHLLYTGMIRLTRGRPEIRVGSRLRVASAGNLNSDYLTTYVEVVEHAWQYKQGFKSAFTVTHGFKGTDQQYKDAVRRASVQWEQLRPTLSDVSNELRQRLGLWTDGPPSWVS